MIARSLLATLALVTAGCLAPEPADLGLAAGLPAAVADAPRATAPAAAPTEIPERLTLADALAIARARAPRLLAARAERGVAAGRLLAARGYPTGASIEAGGAFTPDGKEWAAGISVAHRFELGGQRDQRIAAAAAGVAHANAQALDAERELLADVEAAFAEVLAGEALLAIARESAELATGLLTSAEARVAAGDLTSAAANLVRLDAVRAGAAVREAALARDQARVALLALLGADDRPGLLVEGTLAAALEDPGSLADLLARALASRPDLIALDAEAAEALAEARLARAERAPGLELRAGFELDHAEIEGLTDTDPKLTAGVSVELPGLWNRGAGEVAAAEARAARARAARTARERAIIAAVAVAHRAFASARELATLTAQEIEPLALQNLATTRRAFEAGDADTFSVLRAREDLVRVRAEAARRRLDAARARAALRREAAMGVAP